MRFDAETVRARIPAGFLTDCCSGWPRWVFRRFFKRLKDLCSAHDCAYCSRLWDAGTLDQAWRHAADRHLGQAVRARYPFTLRWISWGFFCAVHRFGGDFAFDSCGADVGMFCRHAQPIPEWMLP